MNPRRATPPAAPAALGLCALLLAAAPVAAPPVSLAAPPPEPVAAAPPAPAPAPVAAAVEFLPVEAIRPGMEGTGRTVFQGDRMEEFRVEILGVMKNAIGPRQDLILARLHGAQVEFAGVVAGMSGSPVYVDGKLIGAVSYRIGQFAKEPIAGITPIADMVRLSESIRTDPPTPPAPGRVAPGRAAASGLFGRFLADAPETGGGPAFADGDGPAPGAGGWLAPAAAPASAGGIAPAAAPAGLQPIGVPLVCSGCDAAVLDYYAPIFRASGLEPAAGGGVEATVAALPLVPGNPIGGALVTGDLSVTGIGTLTHVDGNRVYAFGHPMLGSGPLRMPMTQARVLLTFASSAASFKIANATAPVGTIVQDGLTAIVGEIGAPPPALPVQVRVAAPAGRREFRYDVLRHRAWSPVLSALVTANSLARTTEYDATASLALAVRLDVEGHGPVTFEDLYAGASAAQPVHLQAANDVGSLMNVLANNRFEEAEVRSAVVDIEALPEARIASVAWVRASRNDVRPGETVRVTAAVRPFRGEERRVDFDVTVPEDTRPGEVEIAVGSGPAIDGLERQVLQRQVMQASGIDDLLRLVGRQRKSRALHLRMTRRAPAAIVRSDVLPDLPLSVFSVYNNPRLSADTTLMSEAPILEMSRDLDVAVVGGRRIAIRVR
jgi:hypothetical protein